MGNFLSSAVDETLVISRGMLLSCFLAFCISSLNRVNSSKNQFTSKTVKLRPVSIYDRQEILDKIAFLKGKAFEREGEFIEHPIVSRTGSSIETTRLDASYRNLALLNLKGFRS